MGEQMEQIKEMDQLKEMEQSLHQYDVRTDMAMLYRLLHPDFIEIGYSGITYDFTAIVTQLAKEKPSNSTVWSQDFEYSDLSKDAKLLLYKSANLDQEGKYTRHAKRASVWVKVSDLWQLKYHQATPIATFD